MKTFFGLLFLSLGSTAFGENHMSYCLGVRPATGKCAAQGIILQLNTYEKDGFILETRVRTPLRSCYELTSGLLQQDGTLVADRRVNFYPNYGGFFLKTPEIVGKIQREGNTITLEDNLSGQTVELACVN